MRDEDPKAYGRFLQLYCEIALEGDGTSLSEAQSSDLSALLRDLSERRATNSTLPVRDQLLKEVELDAEEYSGIQALLTDDQRKSFSQMPMSSTLRSGQRFIERVQRDVASSLISESWKERYQLREDQVPQAEAAAKAYLDAVSKQESQSGINAFTMNERIASAEAYAFRTSAVREQVSALRQLSDSMTPAQQDLLKNTRIYEIIPIDLSPSRTSADQEKK